MIRRKSPDKSAEPPETETKMQAAVTPEAASPPGEAVPEFDLERPEWYLNRELTWLQFNKRVLQEARDDRNPLLERVFFLAVVGSNIDEFFMKRIGGLKQQVGAGVTTPSVDGMLPRQQIDACYAMVTALLADLRQTEGVLRTLLAEENIRFCRYSDLGAGQQKEMDRFFRHDVYPLLTPQGIDPAHPFPFISNLSLNLLVGVREKDSDPVLLNRLKVPTGVGVPRFIKVGRGHLYITFEDLIANNLDMLFPGLVAHSCELFRVTRNAITEHMSEQANDLLAMIETALRDRKFADIVRLQVDDCMTAQHRGMLAAELKIDSETDVFAAGGLMAVRDLVEIGRIDRPNLHFPSHQPCDNPDLLADDPNIFHVLRQKGSILLQHPYESFDTSVERFLREASQDPKVLVIKMTLYRTGSRSRIIQYLLDAARNGKQVAVVVELMARFDESANIKWAEAMEEAGIHVSYGVVGLKTHSKVTFVVRRDYDGLRRYAHIGTGNYHAGTARQYSDLGLLTSDPVICEDLTELFNYLTTGYAPTRKYTKILPSPKSLKKALLKKIEREIRLHSPEKPGRIQFKCNALEDKDMTKALYLASQAGVRIDLIIRDSCRLRPGIAGLSDNIRVMSIVGRFLEHTRIYYFQNGGDEEYFIGSADLMKRNLEMRVEVVAPIEDARSQATLREILDIQLGNQRSVWEMRENGEYIQRLPREGDDQRAVHQIFIEKAEKRAAASPFTAKKKRHGRDKRGSALDIA
ncbi:MAG: polyphosphate kinase 1 [Desulfobulbaceae bacterium]|jgi:polyphosphate kinase|nr:polyphosphate kinase 1 [Desulfobulbaceae bacterium]